MIQSLARALEVLEALKEPNKEFSIAQLSDNLQLPPSTTHRILDTLCKYRFVSRDDRTHTYKLGSAVIPLGIVARQNLRLHDNVTPILKSLSSITNEDAFFVVISGNKGLILEKYESTNPLKVVDAFGYERYLHCGAIRRTLLAYQEDSFIKNYVKTVLPLPDSVPKISEETLINSIQKIRSEGVCVSYGEYINGAIGIGAPIFGYNGEIKAAIGIIFLAARLKDNNHLEELKNKVKQHAYELSISMGYSRHLSHFERKITY